LLSLLSDTAISEDRLADHVYNYAAPAAHFKGT
jgi:hypothetical protein